MPDRVLDEAALPSSDQVVCTLFEGNYHLGVGALLNSLLKGGFTGLFWAGHRGPMPPWTAQLHEVDPQLFELPNGARLKFEEVGVGVHFTNYKSNLMLGLIRQGVATKLLWYIDPDITIRCSWKFFETWVGFGISLCSDITNGYLPERHPLRCMWAEVATRAGWGAPSAVQTRYFNAGFIGLDVAYAAFLERWQDAIELAVGRGSDLKDFMSGTREDAFLCPDQDSLNVATMYAPEPISPIGPEGMGFIQGGFTMLHSVGSKKPWNKGFLISALRGLAPNACDKHFLASADRPIRLYSPGALMMKRMGASVSSLIGRFYARR